MPIYEYECPKCGVFEVVQKVSEKPLKSKPECDCADCPKKAQRLISASAFHLKGGGWYKTDYASGGSNSKGSKKSSKEGSDSSSSSESKSESSSDSSGSGEKSEKKSLKTAGKCGSGCGCH